MLWVCRAGRELLKGVEVFYKNGEETQEKWTTEYDFDPTVGNIGEGELRI